MNKEKAKFWQEISDLCPPPSTGLVVHATRPNRARSIREIGLFAPPNYAVLTQLFPDSISREPVFCVFNTFTRPTTEPDAKNDSALHGFPWREPVQEADINSVPGEVRALFPGEADFVHVPPEDLVCIIEYIENKETSKEVGRFVNQLCLQVEGELVSLSEATETLLESGIIEIEPVGSQPPEEILEELLSSRIEVKRRRREVEERKRVFLKRLSAANKQPAKRLSVEVS